MTEGFNINNGGKKEKLNPFRHGIRKDQINEKHKQLFDIFDINKNGTLESDEAGLVENLLSGIAGLDSDKSNLSEAENMLASSIFSGETKLPGAEFLGAKQIADADFMGFVKSASDAASEIIDQKTKTMGYPPELGSGMDVGETLITTTYKDGTIEKIYYYADGEFKMKVTEFPPEKT